MGYKYSAYQEAVFDYLEAKNGSLIVNAVAGSGKTFTMVESLGKLQSKRILFLAFNKRIVEELATKLKAMELGHINVKTFHSLGFAIIRTHNLKVQVDADKIKKIIRDNLGEKAQGLYFGFITKMVSLAKQSGVGILIPDDVPTWMSLAEHYDVTLESEYADEEEGIAYAMQILELSNRMENVVDFDDMIYFPILKNMVVKYRYEFIFVDESQDTNQIQISILKKVLDPKVGRLVAVGDPYQAIYGFRGADSSAMANIKEAFNCHELPLSMSYRCSKTAGELAREFVPHFEVNESNKEGKVEFIADLEKNLDLFTKHSSILCRNTAPLVGFAYFLLRKRIACKILGREIGQGLVNLVRKIAGKKITNVDDLATKLYEFQDREIQKYLSRMKDSQAQAVNDKVESLMFFIDNLGEDDRSINHLISEIEGLFKDGNGCLTLSTIHKAKGLEWDRVFILNRSLMPSRWAKKSWQKEQEANLEYVALTRTKDELYFINYENGGR